jgi:RHS repeat-associated protein
VTGSILIGNNAEQKSAKPKVQTQGDRDFEAVRTHGVRSGIPRRNGNCYGSITNLPSGDTLAYDSEGNLACVSNTVSGAVSLYWYDQHGRRVAKSESGLLTLYIWDGMDIIATAHADGTIREYFTRGIGIAGDVGSLVAETRFSGGTATTTYLHSNWRGDVVMATDTSGNVVDEYAYTTFGEQLSATGTYTPRFTFSSKERDASGLVYHGFRYYSPVLCRWLNEDPIRESGGLNLYQFCFNNPINRVDADGEAGPLIYAALFVLGGIGYANAPGPSDPVYPGGAGEAAFFCSGAMMMGAGAVSSGARGLMTRNVVSRCNVQNLRPTRTVLNHVSTRPYVKSPLTAREIMAAKPPVADPQGVPGALRWDVPGAYNGSSGTWELVVDPNQGQILHWLFKTQ